MSIEAAGTFDVRFLHKDKCSVFLHLPQPYHAEIGLIVAHWGCFESTFDVYLGALRSVIERQDAAGKSRQESGSLARRRREMHQLSEVIFRDKRPRVADQVTALLGRVAELSFKRNLIVHGHYGYTIPPKSSLATDCYAFNNKGEKFYFDQDTLKRLHHDISHATAELIDIFAPVVREKGDFPFIVIPDSELLRVYQDSVHRWNPDPAKRPPIANLPNQSTEPTPHTGK
jgi:hypothetical protein